MSGQRVLITGGAGYVGSVLTERLLGWEYHVTVLDNLLYQQSSLLHLAHYPKFSFVKGDARDERTVKKLVGGVDVIIPLACVVGAPACEKNPKEAIATNLDAVVMLNELRNQDAQKIIFPTTNSGYGTKSGDVFCTENTPLEPISLYGETKVRAEQALLKTPNVITLRLATVFGVSPRMRLDLLVNDFVYKSVRDGYLVIFEKDFKRNYIHIQDVARVFGHCIDNFDMMKNTTYNVGLDDANLSKEELALMIKKHIPKLFVHFEEISKDPDKRNYIVSNTKLMNTGFRCQFSLDDGIKELIKWLSMLNEGNLRNA